MKAYIELKEVTHMEKAASNLRDKILVRLLFHLGCRVSEALGLTVEITSRIILVSIIKYNSSAFTLIC